MEVLFIGGFADGQRHPLSQTILRIGRVEMIEKRPYQSSLSAMPGQHIVHTYHLQRILDFDKREYTIAVHQEVTNPFALLLTGYRKG